MKINRRTFVKGAIAAGIGSLAHTSFTGCFLKRKRTNLILITADTERAESVSCYGYHRPTTPCLDEVAHQGTLFMNSYSTSICTSPGHASIFTGLYPDTTGVISNNSSLAPKFPTLAQILRNEGYQTAAYLGIWILNDPQGISRGFDILDWKESQEPPPLNGIRRSGLYINDVLTCLKRMNQSRKPFFLWVHSFDPHAPYIPPDDFSSLFLPPETTRFDLRSKIKGNLENINGYRPEFPKDFMVSQYDGELRYWDSNFQKIYEFLNNSSQSDDTLLVYTADHGESVGEDGTYGHLDPNQHVTRVPLVLWHPDLIPAQTIQTPVQLTDLAPTILSLLKIKYPPDRYEGKNLVPLILRKEMEDPARPVYIINAGYESAAIVREDRKRKLIKKPLIDCGKNWISDRKTNPAPDDFTDTIIDSDFQWRIEPLGNELIFRYGGKIQIEDPVEKVTMISMTCNPAGNLAVTMMDLAVSNREFSFDFTFPRYRPPDVVGERYPCDFTSTVTTYEIKYSLCFSQNDGKVICHSPWVFCRVADSNGALARPVVSEEFSFLDLETGKEIDGAAKERTAMMETLEGFLNRHATREFQTETPQISQSGNFILPATEEYLAMSPEQVHTLSELVRKNRSSPDTSEQLKEALKNLGYAT